jgi:polyadenylate-binding protein
MSSSNTAAPVAAAAPANAAQPGPAGTKPHPSASLYVGELNNDVTEGALFEIFNQVGPVASIRVCRDTLTRRSLGYAYVNYHSYVDAERALDLLNFKELRGRPCRIMWSQRDPSLRRNGQGNIFIKNLDKTIDHKILYDTFSSFGNILSCKVSTDEHGNSKGFGFVHYETEEAANEAISKTNGKLLNGKKVYVGRFVPRKDRLALEQENPKWTNIFVKNVPKSVSEEKFLELFNAFGNVTSAVLMKDEQGNSKGFGFVNYNGHEEAQAAIDQMNGKDIDGSPLYVGRAQKKSEREKELKEMFEKLKRERMSKYQGVNLYVKNLEDTIDDARLRQEFAGSGTITSAKVMKDEKGASKGFGFVCYATPDEATKAVTELNGKIIMNKPIYVALAQRKDQRRQQLEAIHAQRAAGLRMQQAQQAPGIPGPMYPGPMYAPGRSGGFMYPGVMMPPGRFPAPQGRGGYQGMPGYRVAPIPGGRGGQNRGRGPKVPGGGRPVPGNYPGIKYNANVRNPQNAPATATPVVPEEAAQLPPEERRQVLGETLYPLITASLKNASQDDSLAGKITGMILEATEVTELVQLIESPEALHKKISEALDVLRDATAQPETNA